MINTPQMYIKRMVVGAIATNCYLIKNLDTGEGILVDPGAEEDHIYDELVNNHVKLQTILLTHGHFDHITAIEPLVNRLKLVQKEPVKIYAHRDEEKLLRDANLNCSNMIGREVLVNVDILVTHQEILHLAGFDFVILSTPGHTKGSVCYYCEKEGFLLTGDTLFFESIGRTDLPTGNQGELITSIREQLFSLPEATLVYPGHNEATTIGHEIRENPYV